MANSLSKPTFLVHDYETFGTHPALDRPAQFASIRTDSQFKTLDKPKILFCRPANDYLPEPEAVLMTGITPQKALQDGVTEAEFARCIYLLFNVAGTCILGYNNVCFDDEITRNLFFRNFYDPYGWSWKHGNSRWDILNVVRACYALRPEGVAWPLNTEGLPSFRLKHLTRANNIEHTNAHDAMTDVYATLEVAKLIRLAQPKLFNYLYRHRGKHQLKKLINIRQMTPLVHVSGLFGAARGNTAWIAPLAWHPNNPNALIVCDLSGDTRALADCNSEMLRTRLYTRRAELGSNPAVPLQLVHLNKCPVLAPANTLRRIDAERLGIHREHCLETLQWLKSRPEVKKKVISIFSENTSFISSSNVDTTLYDGFFSDADYAMMSILQTTSPEHLHSLDLSCVDPRLTPLLFRYRARNFPHTLNHDEQLRWLEHRKTLLTEQRRKDYVKELVRLYQIHSRNVKKAQLLRALFDYLEIL
ncbi:exodeoxyribonuclease I [secondary endosymbiont of Ctenarytaina eucalypti]|uniref:Exodeoxyribonuclease I n=1 Tax=secondary endosymbiont of Ctenarytaina eucalypti TaxID=1199245 RepID=J3Z3W4_9ENTR|nr:exodeoxyribonuclease I [secondary endosymbiont of Ctenarytaina eucalypti]AFP84924.1 exonuclease I [secondary endosymbiont of Ctenarytaina eucalypti]